MKRKIGSAAAVVAIAGAMSLGSASVAGAAHCTDSGGPGNSDFATHVKATNGPGAHNEGDHRGWSSCEENSNNFGG